jgi:hypothetical protein
MDVESRTEAAHGWQACTQGPRGHLACACHPCRVGPAARGRRRGHDGVHGRRAAGDRRVRGRGADGGHRAISPDPHDQHDVWRRTGGRRHPRRRTRHSTERWVVRGRRWGVRRSRVHGRRCNDPGRYAAELPGQRGGGDRPAGRRFRGGRLAQRMGAAQRRRPCPRQGARPPPSAGGCSRLSPGADEGEAGHGASRTRRLPLKRRRRRAHPGRRSHVAGPPGIPTPGDQPWGPGAAGRRTAPLGQLAAVKRCRRCCGFSNSSTRATA